MKKEFMIPLWYTIKRDMLRHQHTARTGVVAFASAMLRDYIWIPIYAIYVLGEPNIFQITGIILHLVAFSIAYEMGYIYTDNISIKKEKAKIRRVVYKEPVSDKYTYSSLLIRLAILSGFLFFMEPWLNMEIVYLYISLLVTYLIYGNLGEKFRVPLFLVLRFLKGFVPYAFLLFALDRNHFLFVCIVLLGTAIFSTIEYGSRKLEVTYINVQKIQYLWIRYLIIFSLVVPCFYFSHISFRELSMLFLIYVATHLFTTFLSLLRNSALRTKFAGIKMFDRTF